ncbi:probable transcription factor At1g11510 [Papaver somniferum]|uniref:probable transcription factor At1g11510 n=1 Tax=Papaver somniferum TaxID=3469 RepID=UPI000E6FAACB|nr:probable transcription factor At1g11510 [Papaver somniferum]
MTLKNPPSVSYSSASEEEREVEEEVVNNKEEESDDSGEEEEGGDDDEETEKSRFYVVPNSKSKSKDAEEEEDSDDDSESDEQIPIEKEEEVKKPKHTSIPAKRPAATPAAKPRVEAEKSAKRRKKNNDANGGEESEKKSARVWTEEGEIVLLQGMVDYIKKGKSPNTDSNGFYEFIKGSIDSDVSKEQLSSKIRHAKVRYRQNEAKEMSGEVLTFSKSHFENCYELSKMIWGADKKQENDGRKKKGKDGEGETIEVDGATNGKSKSKSRKKKASNDAGVSEKHEEGVKVDDVADQLKATVEKEEEEEEEEEEGFGLNELILSKEQIIRPPPGLESFLNRRAFRLIDPTKGKTLEKKWKDLQVAETELFLKRIDLVREYSSLALEALKSPTS